MWSSNALLTVVAIVVPVAVIVETESKVLVAGCVTVEVTVTLTAAGVTVVARKLDRPRQRHVVVEYSRRKKRYLEH